MQTVVLVILSLAIAVVNGGCVMPPLSDNSLPDTSIVEPAHPDEELNTTESSLSTIVPPQSTTPAAISTEQEPQEEAENILTMEIRVGDTVFSAVLYDNASAQSLIEQLPMTLDMNDTNRNEKYYYFSEPLPTASESVGNIKTGDIMLYGSDCLVLFYESFSTSYSYTRLGYVENTDKFAEALGIGSVQIIFSIP